MNLGNFGGDHQARNLKQFFVGDLGIGNNLVWITGITQPGIFIRCVRLALAEVIDEIVVLACKKVVIKTQTNTPVRRKCHRLLALPLYFGGAIRRLGILTGREQRQVVVRQAQFGGVARVALDPLQRKFVMAVDLRCVPPRGDLVAGGFG